MTTITFNKKGHDDFIDFIKAYAIICVLLGHTFLFLDKIGYAMWAGMQVPLFILVQSFHLFKKEQPFIDLVKILKRVFLPFVAVEVLTFFLAHFIVGYSCNELIDRFISGGGYGPGAYYPWIYLQVALLLPFFYQLYQRCGKITVIVVTLLLCEGLEILMSVTNFPESVYRLLAIRYIFLFVLGWIWVKEGIKVNYVSIILSVVSLMSIIYFQYFSTNDEPWFFTTNWKYHRWPCYFYVAYGLTTLLYVVWRFLMRYPALKTGIKYLAESTYEIFLAQMSIIFLFHKSILSFVGNNAVQFIIWVFIVWAGSIWGGVFLHKFLSKLKYREAQLKK